MTSVEFKALALYNFFVVTGFFFLLFIYDDKRDTQEKRKN